MRKPVMRIKETINSKGHVRVTYELRNDSDRHRLLFSSVEEHPWWPCAETLHTLAPPPSRPTSLNGYQWAFREIDELQGGVICEMD